MRLSPKSLLTLFVVGAGAGLIGDHAAVATGTTRYLGAAGFPFVWGSPLFFPLMVGIGTACLGELGARLGGARPRTRWEGFAAVAAVLAMYVLTSVLSDESTSAATALMVCLAFLVLVRFGEGRPSLIVLGTLAALVGPAVEILEHRIGIFEYTANVDGLLGVAPWLVPLYFAFGVVAGRLGELLAEQGSPDATGACERIGA